jgi:hypothetical protein
MPCVLVPDPPSPLPQHSGAAARTSLVLAPLAMALAGLAIVDVGQPVARKSTGRPAVREPSAECLVAQAVFAGAQLIPPEPQRAED